METLPWNLPACAPSLQRPHLTLHLPQVGSQVLQHIVGREETEKRLREKGLVPQWKALNDTGREA